MEKVNLTKSILGKFIQWTTSRYNNYCGYGTKKENVETVYNSMVNGFYTDDRGKKDESVTVFTIMCASGVGENGNGRYWKTKSAGDEYTIDCVNRTITTKYNPRSIAFLPVR